MDLDFIGVVGKLSQLVIEEGLAGENPAWPIGAIVRLWCPVPCALCSVALAGKARDLRQQSAVVITVTCNQITMQTGHHVNTSQ
ncbi:hypothetical protein RY45_15545 [Aeromonas hydrophila]|nr:hypothetical protein RY45_15545 [Aeromonas hydrophila]